MQTINRAVSKLSAIFTAILMLVSVGFSVAVYSTTASEMERPLPEPTRVIYGGRNPDFEIIFRDRSREIRASLLVNLIIINTAVLVLGALGSYFLARYVLDPVRRNMEAQAQFVSDASHELRTPLTVIAMENETTLRDQSASKTELKKQVKSNLEEVGKLRALTDRLLRLSLDEKPEITEVDLAEIASTACANLQKLANGQKITIKNQVKPHSVQANREALTEITTILLDNAIKYSPAGSSVVLGNRQAELFVRDHGVGISDTDLPHIFDRFYRSEKSRTTSGFGLGLPLAKRLADQMNLQITARQNKGAGMTFTVSKR